MFVGLTTTDLGGEPEALGYLTFLVDNDPRSHHLVRRLTQLHRREPKTLGYLEYRFES